MDPRDRYRDKFGEASTAVPFTCFNNELIYFGKLIRKFSQVVNRIASSSLANAFERFRVGPTATDVDVSFAAVSVYFDDRNFKSQWMKEVSLQSIFNTLCTHIRVRHVVGVPREGKAYYDHCPASRSGDSQNLTEPGLTQILMSRGSVGLQLAIDNFQMRTVSVSYHCATMHNGFAGSMLHSSGIRNRILAVSSSGYGEHATAFLFDCLTREIGGNTKEWCIRPYVLQKKRTFECKRSGIISGVREYHTLCRKWPWTSADLVPVSKEAVVNDHPMSMQAVVSRSYENFGKRNVNDLSQSLSFTSTVVAVITGLDCPQPSSRVEENLLTLLETVLHCDIDQVLTFHEATKVVRKPYFKKKSNPWPAIVGNVVAILGDNRSEIETGDWVLTFREAKTFRKSYFKGNTNPWPTIVGKMKNMVNVLSENRSEIETSKPVLESLLHFDVDQVPTLHRAKTARRSYFEEQTNRLNPNHVGMNQNGSTFKVGVLQNRMTDVIQQCVFNETMLLLLVKNRVLLRGGSLAFCARCLNPQAKTCKSHIISRCVLEQIFGNSMCMYISQKEEHVSSNGCWFRLQCRNCDNSTCADENKFKKRFCAEELKVLPQKIPAVELRVIIAFFFRGIMANVDLLLPLARNQEWQGILNCVLRLREQCIKPRSAIEVISCKLSNDSALRSQSVEFPILVSSEKWGSFFYLRLQQYCYAIPIEQQWQRSSLQASFPAVVKAISGKLRQKREKYLRNFSKPINQALMVTGYVTGGHLFI